MKHRFLLHLLSHTILIIDISKIRIAADSNPGIGNITMVPTLRLPAWKEAEQYLRANGADGESIERAHITFKKAGFAVLTIT
jgi:hypothetical protein